MDHPIENHQPFSSGVEKIIIIESYDDLSYQIIHSKNKRKVYPHLRVTIEQKYLLESEEENKSTKWNFFFFLSYFQCDC